MRLSPTQTHCTSAVCGYRLSSILCMLRFFAENISSEQYQYFLASSILSGAFFLAHGRAFSRADIPTCGRMSAGDHLQLCWAAAFLRGMAKGRSCRYRILAARVRWHDSAGNQRYVEAKKVFAIECLVRCSPRATTGASRCMLRKIHSCAIKPS